MGSNKSWFDGEQIFAFSSALPDISFVFGNGQGWEAITGWSAAT